MKKSIKNTLLTLVVLLSILPSVLAQKTIQEGTVIRVRLLETLDSRTANMGEMVALEAADPLMIDGVIVIETGAKVTGKVIESVKNKSLGRKGKLDFSIDFVKAKDGQNVPLSSNIKQGGKDAVVGVVAAAAIINPLALFIKGKAATINKGTEFNCYVSRDVKVNVK
ncbi:MAG: hypothetical protein ACO3AY_00655 [Chitinophagaceae bacterium]|jgi:ribosomal protein L21